MQLSTIGTVDANNVHCEHPPLAGNVAGGRGLKSVNVTYASARAPMISPSDYSVIWSSKSGYIKVEGTMKNGSLRIVLCEIDVSIKGKIILCRQADQARIIGSLRIILCQQNVNVSFTSVGRTRVKDIEEDWRDLYVVLRRLCSLRCRTNVMTTNKQKCSFTVSERLCWIGFLNRSCFDVRHKGDIIM
ncbi:hypothetical protein Tco_1075473 [Tanacetum coccineum]